MWMITIYQKLPKEQKELTVVQIICQDKLYKMLEAFTGHLHGLI